MAKGAYVGINNIAHKVTKGYIGIDSIARKIKKAYVGDSNNLARLWWSSKVEMDKLFGDMTVILNSSWSDSSRTTFFSDLGLLDVGETAYILTLCHGLFAVHRVTNGSTSYQTIFRSNTSDDEYQQLYYDTANNRMYLSSTGRSALSTYTAMMLLVKFPYSDSDVEMFFNNFTRVASDYAESSLEVIYLTRFQLSNVNLIITQIGQSYGFSLWDYTTNTITQLKGTRTPVYSNNMIYAYNSSIKTRGNIIGCRYNMEE